MKAHYWLCLTIVYTAQMYGTNSSNFSVIPADVMEEQQNNHTRLGTIAFHAYPSKHIKIIRAHSGLVFDVATENTGNAYDSFSGVFSAPYDGVYVFHLTTMIPPGKELTTILKVNGANMAYNQGYAFHNKDSISPSQMFVGRLKRGGVVWLSTDDQPGHYLNGGIYSTFSGFLL